VSRVAALCIAAAALAAPARSAEPALPRDGWSSWRVDAVEGAPAWCCWSHRPSATPQKPCRLDEHPDSFGSRDDATTDSVRVYVRTAGGKIERLRVLSDSCPVETATPVKDLATLPADDSVRWMIALNERTPLSGGQSDLHEATLAGIAIHRGNLAYDYLSTMARGDSAFGKREKAVFWLALLRGHAGAGLTRDLMFNDGDARIRRHAAFASTMSKSTTIGADLVRLGNTDTDGEVRAQAWFWLAQTRDPGAERAIDAALRKDTDDHVREQAVFALSRLPDERATRALIAVAEDTTLTREQRKRALFWLAQQESPGGQAYLEKVLAGRHSPSN
jgi:hypothetical protein